MAGSEVDICNQALALLGADEIRSFEESNKRSRMCKKFYDFNRDYLLSRFDWPFARDFETLQELDVSTEDVPEGEKAFQLPSDCRTPRDVHPPGSSTVWRIVGDRLFTTLSSVGLYYTKQETNFAVFSDTFASVLALKIAVSMCGSLTQDKELAKTLYGQYLQELREAQESDANIGNDYRTYDENPENDSFVTGEAIGNNSYSEEADAAT